MSKQRMFCRLLLVLGLAGCGTRGSGLLYVEPSIKRQDVQIRRVAIAPNRLPLNLQDPEKWRKYNWKVIKENFEKHGVEVVDYEITVDAFNKSGLPVEDTKASREKYSDLSQQLGVDMIVVPYYATSSSTKSFLFLITHSSFTTVATFQIYLTQQNDFLSRIDTNGKNRYTTGLYFLPLTGLLFWKDKPDVIKYLQSGILIVGPLYDLIQTSRSDDSRLQAAFKRSIKEALKPFFASYSLLPRENIPPR